MGVSWVSGRNRIKPEDGPEVPVRVCVAKYDQSREPSPFGEKAAPPPAAIESHLVPILPIFATKGTMQGRLSGNDWLCFIMKNLPIMQGGIPGADKQCTTETQ